VSTTTLSYGAYYTTKHVIKLPPTDAPLEVILQIKNPAKKDDCKQITLKSDNVDKSGTPLMKVGDILDASTPLLGQGRWQNAVVTEIASPTATMPTKYDNTWGTIASLVAILDDTKIPKNALTSILNVANTDANTTLSRIAANSNVSTNLKNMATANAGKAQMPSYQNIWYAKDKLGVSTASISGSNSVDAYVIEKIANTNKFHLYRETTAFEYNLDAQYDGWTMAHVLCQLAY
jgi:hypothetical protein